jgi:hypothetical protein
MIAKIRCRVIGIKGEITFKDIFLPCPDRGFESMLQDGFIDCYVAAKVGENSKMDSFVPLSVDEYYAYYRKPGGEHA